MKLANPLNLAAIDAGSNALRLMIVRVRSTDHWEVLESIRAPIRLGHAAFTTGEFDRKTLRDAVSAFRQFHRTMERHGVSAYRAVATSAAREAGNRHVLIRRIREEAKIDLEVISGEEEARLVCVAAMRALHHAETPRFILDLGGGSLELSELRGGILKRSVGLPLGTVRLMEAFHIQGTVHEHTADDLKRHIASVLHSALPDRPAAQSVLAVACGGNAETLAALASGPKVSGLATLNTRLLQERLWEILQLDVPGRMRAFGVRRDRAEVMGVAAIVLVTVAKWLRIGPMLIPRVGVREGVLYELVAAQLAPPEASPEQRKNADLTVSGACAFVARVGCDLNHGQQVCRLALQLFDQLWSFHRMDRELRTMLAAAALLHDSGQAVHRKAHHRHGEYLVRHGKIAGLRGWARNMVASLVRYHNGKSEPSAAHDAFAALNRTRRKHTRLLAGMLRLAERLESDHRQAIASLTLEGGPQVFRVHLELREGIRANLAGIERKARLLEREMNIQLSFHRVLCVEKERVA